MFEALGALFGLVVFAYWKWQKRKCKYEGHVWKAAGKYHVRCSRCQEKYAIIPGKSKASRPRIKRVG